MNNTKKGEIPMDITRIDQYAMQKEHLCYEHDQIAPLSMTNMVSKRGCGTKMVMVF